MQFSIVSYLDDTATAQVRELQHTISKITHSRASLSAWAPHVTLGDGIEVEEAQLAILADEFQRLATYILPFTVGLSDFNSLDNRPLGTNEVSTPYALFIDVKPNEPLLSLVAQIKTITDTYPIWYSMPRPYLPHVTLAFRDLSREGFEAGSAYLADKTIHLSSTIDHIALVEKLATTDAERQRFWLTS